MVARAFVILSGTPDGEGFAYANRHHTALTTALGIELKRSPSDTAFRYFFLQMDVAALCAGIRDWTIAQINACPFFLTSIRTTPEALLQLVRDRWSIEGWHWIRDTQLKEDAHRYRGNGAGVMGYLRTVALNLMRLGGFASIRSGMPRMSHDITAMLEMARRRPEPSTG